jgi:hypothetical protein
VKLQLDDGVEGQDQRDPSSLLGGGQDEILFSRPRFEYGVVGFNVAFRSYSTRDELA